jgi:predicted HicB family RNase H-like nuclease
MSQLNYKGYIGSICFSKPDGVYWGEIIGITDSISYEGETVELLKEDFEYSVDDYLEFCKEVGKEPQKTSFTVNLSPELYNMATLNANQKGLPLNLFVENAIRNNIAAHQ